LSRFLSISITAILLTSCLGTRHLSEGEYLLRKQKITGNEAISKGELENLIRQEPNKKLPLIPFAPYVWVYHFGKRSFSPEKAQVKLDRIEDRYAARMARHSDNPDRVERLKLAEARKREKRELELEEGNMLMRWGEPLAVFDVEAAETSRRQMQTYLQTRGHFRSGVELEVSYDNRMAYVNYSIREGDVFRIDTVRYIANDSTIYRLITDFRAGRILKPGNPYVQDDLTAERERIEGLLKNSGYFDFSRQYIVYEVDTNRIPGKADIALIVRNPARRGFHRVFRVDSINFVTDAGAGDVLQARRRLTYGNINYQYIRKQFSQKVLDQRVFIAVDSLYSLRNTLDTQRQLALLDNYKFININYDTTGGRFVANIFTSPLPKYQATNEVGLNVTQGFPGPFYNLSFVNRNIFNGLENLELSGYFGFEGVASVTTNDVFSSLDAGAKAVSGVSAIYPGSLFSGA
jgi:outer membrane protein insertion porin family